MNTGIVLSGGAAKCIVHLGACKALFELGVKPYKISAVSGGALFGCFIAAGIDPETAIEKALKAGDFNFLFPSVKSDGLLSMSKIEDTLREMLPVSTFEELQIPMVINATDILTGETLYFSKGDLLKPIIASSSYPAIFEPVEIDGRQLLDGGIMNNFPVEPLIADCDQIIGISTGKVYPMEKMGSVQRVFIRSLELAINEGDRQRMKHCDLLLEPPGLNEYGLFDISKGEEIFRKGYEYTISRAAEIRAL